MSWREDSDGGEEDAIVGDGDGVEFVGGEDLEDEKKRPRNEGRNCEGGGGEASGEEAAEEESGVAAGP